MRTEHLALSARGVKMQYRDRGTGNVLLAIDNIDLDVPDGAFVSLLGPSGCGKSTFLKIVNGLLPATAGEIKLHRVAKGREDADEGFLLNLIYFGGRASARSQLDEQQLREIGHEMVFRGPITGPQRGQVIRRERMKLHVVPKSYGLHRADARQESESIAQSFTTTMPTRSTDLTTCGRTHYAMKRFHPSAHY